MTQSARLGLPFLEAGQAQKEWTHNEALQLVDLAVAAAVEGPPGDVAPAAPEVGACYLVGSAPQGAWVGHAHALAGWFDGGWRFVVAVEGLRVLDKTNRSVGTFIAGAWQFGPLLGGPLAAMAAPSGGSVVDAEARAAIAAILARLRDHRLIAP